MAMKMYRIAEVKEPSDITFRIIVVDGDGRETVLDARFPTCEEAQDVICLLLTATPDVQC
jgi:hypothetical protein